MFWKTFLAWSALNAAITALPLLALPMFATGGPDLAGLQLMAVVAALGVGIGVALIVLPCALLTAGRLPAAGWMSFVPFIALGPYTIAVMASTGVFMFVLLVPQIIVAVTLSGLVARRLRMLELAA